MAGWLAVVPAPEMVRFNHQDASSHPGTNDFEFHEYNAMNSQSAACLVGLGRVLAIDEGEPLVAGRSKHAHFQLSSPTCSNIHFRIYAIQFDEGYDMLVYCQDLSLNGTFHNGNLVGRNNAVLLTNEDSLQIKNVAVFTFHQAESAQPFDSTIMTDCEWFKGRFTLTKRLLGNGSYGKVYMTMDKKSGKQAACKIVEKRKPSRVSISREIELLTHLSHPNIVPVLASYQSASRFYIFEELITGGDTFSLRQSRPVSEAECLFIVWQILQALIYLHEQGIAHRDLKPDNILLMAPFPGSRIVLTDFGVAGFFGSAKRMETLVGTADYMAPDLFHAKEKGYGQEVDMWSLGVVVHFLLGGRNPFGTMSGRNKVDKQISLQQARDIAVSFEDDVWDQITNQAKDFICACLSMDASKRLTARSATEHVWLANVRRELNGLYYKQIICDAVCKKRKRVLLTND